MLTNVPTKSSSEELPHDTEKSDSIMGMAKNANDNGKPSLSRKQVMMGRLQFAALCWCFFVIGWNDGSTGPLLPRIQEVYQVNFIVVSLIFVVYCIGVIVGSFANLFLSDRLGLGKILVIGSCCQNLAYILQALALPFPVFVVCFSAAGLGISFAIAHGCGFVAALRDHTKMGFLHAAYGLGAMVSPIVSTQFSQLRHWSFHYFVSCGVSLINTALLLAIFRLQPQDVCFAEAGEIPPETGDEDKGAVGKTKEIMRTPAVHLVAFFILVYVGVEVALGGWTVTYIIRERNGGQSSGYVSTGFYGGLTSGRIALLWLNKKLGERRAILIYAALSIGLEFIVWFVPSLVGDAIAVSFVGFFLGPMYPIAMNECGRILPPWILTNSIGWINALGFTGSALVPFMTGAISQRWGIRSLQPLVVIMMGIMTAIWLFVPKKPYHSR